MKKYHGKFYGKPVAFTKDEYAVLLKRFDYSNREEVGRLSGGAYREIEVECPMCAKYLEEDCFGCTFKKFKEGKVLGCFNLLMSIVKEHGIYTMSCLDLSDQGISWREDKKKTAKKALDIIHEELKKMGKEE